MRTKPDAHEYAIASTLEQMACVNVSLHAAYHANGRIDCVAVAETDRGDEIASVARGNFIDAIDSLAYALDVPGAGGEEPTWREAQS